MATQPPQASASTNSAIRAMCVSADEDWQENQRSSSDDDARVALPAPEIRVALQPVYAGNQTTRSLLTPYEPVEICDWLGWVPGYSSPRGSQKQCLGAHAFMPEDGDAL